MTKLDDFRMAEEYAKGAYDNVMTAIKTLNDAHVAEREARYAAVLEVGCPLKHCGARAHQPCRFDRDMRLYSTHGARDDLAGCGGPARQKEITENIRQGGGLYRWRKLEDLELP